MKTVLITGATSGLGLAMARAIDRTEGFALVLAVRDEARGRAVASSLRRGAHVMRLDVSSLADVRAFTDRWDAPLHALVNNAGVQLVGKDERTPEGIETTMATNYLGPTLLTLGLLPHLRGGRVIGIGSGTHDPANRGASRFGFRGARLSTVAALARGEAETTVARQRGLDRYATSKLLVMLSALALAERHPGTRFLTFDPGMVPGTGLARGGGIFVRIVWSTVLRWLVPLMQDASSEARSADALVWLLEADALENGAVYDFRKRLGTRVSREARDARLAGRTHDETLAFLGERSPSSLAAE